jgi:putative SOS response-associated peptidase YedK
MCASMMLRASMKSVLSPLGAINNSIWQDLESEIEIFAEGFRHIQKFPVIRHQNGQIQLEDMHFSLCPHWSKTWPATNSQGRPLSTYNARLTRKNSRTGQSELIFQTPTWRDPFSKGQTCLIPITQIYEYCYFGHSKGFKIEAFARHKNTFFAAGLWSEWQDSQSKEIKKTFTLLTDDPSEFFYENGHDRSLIIMDTHHHHEWLENKRLKPKERFDFLRTNRVDQEWDLNKISEMKNWKKHEPSVEDIEKMPVWKKP